MLTVDSAAAFVVPQRVRDLVLRDVNPMLILLSLLSVPQRVHDAVLRDVCTILTLLRLSMPPRCVVLTLLSIL